MHTKIYETFTMPRLALNKLFVDLLKELKVNNP